MLKKIINNNISIYMVLVLLSLSACIAQKEDTSKAKNNKPSTSTTKKTTEHKTIKSVISFEELVQKYGSQEAALQHIMTLEMVILDFYTDWCPPCKRLAPMLVAASKLITDVTFVKINAETFAKISQQFSIRHYPTLICLRNGVKIDIVKNLSSESELISDIKRAFNLSEKIV